MSEKTDRRRELLASPRGLEEHLETIQAQQRRISALETERARLLASLLAVTDSAHADFPQIALDWDNADDARKREWCQWLYEHAAKQDARIAALEAERKHGFEQVGAEL